MGDGGFSGDDCSVEDKDCVGSFSTCGADCADAVFEIASELVGEGAACDHAADATQACNDGDGACVVDDCVGSFSTCGADCADAVYSITTEATNGGQACDHAA